MNNSITFASRKLHTMGIFHISLDNDLVAKVEQIIKPDGSFQQWLQDQVNLWLKHKVAYASAERKTHSRTSDEALSEKLKDLPPLLASDFPDLSDADYTEYVEKHSGHLPKGIEKWL